MGSKIVNELTDERLGETETQMLVPASVKNTPAGTSQETLVSFIISRENPLHGVPFLRL